MPAHFVTAFLADHLPGPVPRLPGVPSAEMLDTAARGGLAGGAAYGLVVARAAHRAGARLLSLATYEAAGVAYELL